MSNPFKIDGPTCLSLSGGRTSMFMWRMVLDSNPEAVLRENLRTCFANTGKEREETLRFVDRASREWGYPVEWVEFVSRYEDVKHRVVTFETASRNGEPFERLIEEKKFLPNAVMRFCTEELKVKPIRDLTGLGEEDTLVGVRADEPRRIPKMRARGLRIPLVEAGIAKADVRGFWKRQPFDLELDERNGVTPWGNCDLCFLKGPLQVQALVAAEPERAVWWAAQERRVDGTFSKDRPSYAAMRQFAKDQADMFAGGGIDCFCGD